MATRHQCAPLPHLWQGRKLSGALEADRSWRGLGRGLGRRGLGRSGRGPGRRAGGRDLDHACRHSVLKCSCSKRQWATCRGAFRAISQQQGHGAAGAGSWSSYSMLQLCTAAKGRNWRWVLGWGPAYVKCAIGAGGAAPGGCPDAAMCHLAQAARGRQCCRPARR